MKGGRAELLVAALLAAAALAACGFVVVYVVDVDTQFLGVALGLSLLALAAAAIVAGKALVPQEVVAEERPDFTDPDGRPGVEREARELDHVAAAGVEGISRRRLLGTAAGAAGAAVGAAIVVPIASLGPAVGDRLRESPWADGVSLVDENGLPVPASHLETGSFLTAFAEGSDPERLASSVVVVRVDPGELSLPPDRRDWAPEGIMAYSKICTHAGCAVNLFRSPLYPPRTPGPALVCPCHYSTFNVLDGGTVVFGPAGRPLPQLPLRIDSRGHLIAAGPLSGNVGPAWSGVRQS
ncbi:MAG TPA: Rieske (2Fe-2S) protein [Solirubrobacterales bacterium]|nr:Rieske (2Fe-2S) protein [Solirubrobacterales bacterium]